MLDPGRYYASAGMVFRNFRTVLAEPLGLISWCIWTDFSPAYFDYLIRKSRFPECIQVEGRPVHRIALEYLVTLRPAG